MNPSEIWLLKDSVNRGTYKYTVGESVVVARRNKNGYPRKLSDETLYEICSIEDSFLSVIKPGDGSYNAIRVHKYYLIPKGLIRDLKLNVILK